MPGPISNILLTLNLPCTLIAKYCIVSFLQNYLQAMYNLPRHHRQVDRFGLVDAAELPS